MEALIYVFLFGLLPRQILAKNETPKQTELPGNSNF